MEQVILPGRKGQVPVNGGEAQMVGAQHEAGGDDDKPLKSSLTGKQGRKANKIY